MKRLKNFFITSIIGGVLVILPVALIVWVFSILVNFIVKYINPVTHVVDRFIGIKFVSIITAVAVIITICFLVGMFVTTRIGNWIHINIEERLLSKIPGYKMIKGALSQLFSSDKKSRPFSKVVLFSLYNNNVLMTGIVTDDDNEKYVTIFCPTAPNPTSGFIYHVPREQVYEMDETVEDTMRTVLSGGFGSNILINKYLDKYAKNLENNETENKS